MWTIPKTELTRQLPMNNKINNKNKGTNKKGESKRRNLIIRWKVIISSVIQVFCCQVG
jgi:hypothetical protein